MIRLPSIASAGALGILTIPLGACAGYQHYQPAPLAPLDEARAYNARRLDDPALAHVLAAHGVPANDTAWDSRSLAIAALYFRPDLTEAQRALAAARAGETTAGARPYPSVTVTTNRAARADGGHATPWSFSLTAGFRLERGGKREARIARARAATLAVRLRLESAAWRIVQGARQAGVSAVGADVDFADAEREAAALRTVLQLLRGRYAEGQLPRTELARSATDVQTAAVGASQAARARTDARSTLARALAVPLRQVDQLPLRPEARSGCHAVDSRSLDTLQTLALRTLPGVGEALADYSVAEADLRVQIAQQYPDVVLGPGIAWEQGVQRWLLSFALPNIATDRARGPIAEAAARRAVQAARVRSVQDSVLTGVDSAVAACRHIDREVAVADSLVRSSGEQHALAQAAYQRGEIGQTEVAFAELGLVRTRRTQHQAAERALASGIALENAIGIWLSERAIPWQDLIVSPDSIGSSRDSRPDHRR